MLAISSLMLKFKVIAPVGVSLQIGELKLLLASQD